MQFIKEFKDITLADLPLVGGKTASLGQMIQDLSSQGIRIPDGFAITADAYWHIVQYNQLMPRIEQLMNQVDDYNDLQKLHEVGQSIRALFINAVLSYDLVHEITNAYKQLCKIYNKKNVAVAVRSSATAEDLPGASFAGQQESFLHVSGIEELLLASKKCFASLFTDRAIAYRHDKNFDYRHIALSIAVQKMVNADKAISGVAFSLDTESGFKNVVLINASYGLGESIVQGMVVPDEYGVFKPTLKTGHAAIIKKKLGNKKIKVIASKKR